MKELITKINDRNIQRKRESGLTGYVLISGLIICLYKLFKHSEFLLNSSVYERENLHKSVELICYTFNILFFSGVLIYYLFPNLKTLNHIKFLKENKTEGYIFLSMFLSYFIGTTLILYILFTKQNPQKGFYTYCVFIFLFNLISWFTFYLLVKNDKLKPWTIQAKQDKYKNSIIVSIIFVSLIVTSVSSFFAYQIEISYKSQIIKIIILAYFSYVIIEKMLQVNSNDLFYSKLEAFEYEIKLRKVEDDDQIRKEFQERFTGFMVIEWINNQIKLAEFRLLTYRENIESINSQINEISNQKFAEKSLEIKLINKLEDEKSLHLDYYIESCIKQKNELEIALKNNLSEFDNFEKQQLRNLIEILKNQL